MNCEGCDLINNIKCLVDKNNKTICPMGWKYMIVLKCIKKRKTNNDLTKGKLYYADYEDGIMYSGIIDDFGQKRSFYTWSKGKIMNCEGCIERHCNSCKQGILND